MGISLMPRPNQPILLAEMQMEFTIDGRLISAPARVIQRLWPEPSVVIEVSDVLRAPQPIAKRSSGSTSKKVVTFPLTSEGPLEMQLESGISVNVVPTSWLPHQQDAELHLQESPSVVLNSGKPMVRLQYDVLNITRDLFHWPLALQAPPWLVRIDPVPRLGELEKSLRSDGRFAVTHSGTIQRSDRKGFSGDDAQYFLGAVGHFLSFVCGTQCGISNVVGFDSDGNEAWKQWGSYHVSPWQRHRSWADITIRDALSDIFECFWLTYRKSSKHLDRVLGWYVYSNETEALDLSIVLNQTILEVLTTLMPSGKGKGGPIGQRIADMVQQQGIDPQIPARCSELIAMAKHYNLTHGPHTLVAIRNSIVHANANLGQPSIDTYHEAKQLGLWYVELLLLKMFKYTGEYASRLTEVQRAGATELVPWASGGQP